MNPISTGNIPREKPADLSAGENISRKLIMQKKHPAASLFEMQRDEPSYHNDIWYLLIAVLPDAFKVCELCAVFRQNERKLNGRIPGNVPFILARLLV